MWLDKGDQFQLRDQIFPFLCPFRLCEPKQTKINTASEKGTGVNMKAKKKAKKMAVDFCVKKKKKINELTLLKSIQNGMTRGEKKKEREKKNNPKKENTQKRS